MICALSHIHHHMTGLSPYVLYAILELITGILGGRDLPIVSQVLYLICSADDRLFHMLCQVCGPVNGFYCLGISILQLNVFRNGYLLS